MKDIIQALSLSKKIILKDKVCLLLCLSPVVIGLILYYFVGQWFYGPVLSWGNELVARFISKDALNIVIYYIFFGLISVFLFVLIGYTFNLVVSILASPFNDFLSGRVEKILLGEKPQTLQEGLMKSLRNFLVILREEIKKIIVISLIALIAVVLGFFPILAPVSFFLSAVCLSIQFLDYTWCRREMSFRSCFRDLKKFLFSYSFAGVLFSFIMMVPILSLFCISYAVVFYTIIWLLKYEKERISVNALEVLK